MSTSTTADTLVTADQLFDMAAEDGRYELVEGELRSRTPGGSEHGAIGFDVGMLVGTFVRKHKLGRMFTAETGFLIHRNPDTVQAPDLAFVRNDRLEQLGLSTKYFPEPPAFVVEVVSPSDRVDEVDDKMRRWISSGVELGWVLHPRIRTVTVYRALDDIRVFTENDMLEGEPVLSGFSCRVSDLFVP